MSGLNKVIALAQKRIIGTKIFMFAVIILLIGGITWIIDTVVTRYDVMRYEDSVDVFIGKGVESGNVTAVYGEQKILVNLNNFQAMRSLLTITERQKLLSPPSTENRLSIMVTVDEENYFIVYYLNENGDTLLRTCLDGKIRNFFIDGPHYQVFDRMLKYMSPGGVNDNN